MTDTPRAANLLAQLEHLNEQQLRRLLVKHLTKQKLGLYWEANAIERDTALNADLVLPRLVEEWSHTPSVRPELVEGGMDAGGSTGSPRTVSNSETFIPSQHSLLNSRVYYLTH